MLPDGSLDDEFQDGGRFVNDAGLGGLTAATDVALDSSERIVVSIGSLGRFAVMRLNGSDGSFDSTFGENGVAVHNHPDAIDQTHDFATAVQIGDGNSVVLGGCAAEPDSGEHVFALLRLTEEGGLDTNAVLPGGERMIIAFPDEALREADRAMPFPNSVPATVDVELDVRPIGGDDTWTLEWSDIDPTIFSQAPLADGTTYIFPLRSPDVLVPEPDAG